MFSKMKINSKNIKQENNSIFKQLNTNIISDYQRNKYLIELIQNQQNTTFYQKDININENINIYKNGTIEYENNNMFLQTQRAKFKSNKPISNNNSNINKSKQKLNRYNSYSRINTNNRNNNNTINANGNKLTSKNKKMSNNNQGINKILNNNNSRGHYNMNLNNQRTPISSKKKNFIPLGNNKFKTIGENNNYSTFGNKLYNDTNINRTFIQKNEHNTIDLNNFYINKQSNINKKYNMKRPPTNINYNLNHNCNINNKPYNPKNNKYNYNYKNVDIHNNIRKNGGSSRPKTPDFSKRKKSSKFFNNQRAKTPDRERNKMTLYLDKDYLNTIDIRDNKRINHYNYQNRIYNHTIDNNNNNKNRRLNTNDYFRMNKKTINNYDYKDHSTINTNNNTISSNKNNSKRYIHDKINKNNSNQKAKKVKKLLKNASQGNILGHNNYNINLNSNGINHINKKINGNNNTHCYSNTNLVTPIKYVNQRSNFKGKEIQMTQVRSSNNYNIYEETFQSFGRNIPSIINNNELNSKKYYNINKIENNNDIQNYFKLKRNNDEAKIKNLEKENVYYDYEKYKRLSLQNNNNNAIQELNYGIREKNGNYNNPYIPATINNMENKTYSIFNYKKGKMKENVSLNYNDNIQDYNETNKEIDIDFNDLDQFSPPYKAQLDLANNNEKAKSNTNKFINIGNIQEGKDNLTNYNMEFNNKNNYDFNYGDRYLKENIGENNRKVIDDFIKQLKTKF